MLKKFFRKKKELFDREKLTVCIMADVRDVDPDENYSEKDYIGSPIEKLPPINLAAEWFLPRITLQLCLDTEDGFFCWLTEEEIARWGVQKSDLFSMAIENLNKHTVPKVTVRKHTVDDAVFYTTLCEGANLSSLILADDFWSDFNFVKGDIAVAIPDRDTLYFCNRHSPESLNILSELGDVVWNDPETIRKFRITRDLLIADKGGAFGWVPRVQVN